jgi:tRNA G18 (ribose-2'-O)-methylase SpoU
MAHDGREYTEVDLTTTTALVLGNEAAGVAPRLQPWIDETVSIPMAGRADSLNVGMAAAVLCFEAARQRRRRGCGTPGRPGRPSQEHGRRSG